MSSNECISETVNSQINNIELNPGPEMLFNKSFSEAIPTAAVSMWEQLIVYYLARIKGLCNWPTPDLIKLREHTISSYENLECQVINNIFKEACAELNAMEKQNIQNFDDDMPEPKDQGPEPKDQGKFMAAGYEEGKQQTAQIIIRALKYGVMTGILEKNDSTYRISSKYLDGKDSSTESITSELHVDAKPNYKSLNNRKTGKTKTNTKRNNNKLVKNKQYQVKRKQTFCFKNKNPKMKGKDKNTAKCINKKLMKAKEVGKQKNISNKQAKEKPNEKSKEKTKQKQKKCPAPNKTPRRGRKRKLPPTPNNTPEEKNINPSNPETPAQEPPKKDCIKKQNLHELQHLKRCILHSPDRDPTPPMPVLPKKPKYGSDTNIIVKNSSESLLNASNSNSRSSTPKFSRKKPNVRPKKTRPHIQKPIQIIPPVRKPRTKSQSKSRSRTDTDNEAKCASEQSNDDRSQIINIFRMPNQRRYSDISSTSSTSSEFSLCSYCKRKGCVSIYRKRKKFRRM